MPAPVCRIPPLATPSIPTPGTAAYWRAQREAVTLFRSFRELLDDPELLLPVLHEIAAHGSARRMLASHGHDIERILDSCEDNIASWAIPASADDGTWGSGGGEPPPEDERHSKGCPTEISFTSRGQHVCVEFGISNGLTDLTVFVAPADADAAPGMGVLHLAPAPDQARAIARTLLALADAAERGA